jgi:hypothetical protein
MYPIVSAFALADYRGKKERPRLPACWFDICARKNELALQATAAIRSFTRSAISGSRRALCGLSK